MAHLRKKSNSPYWLATFKNSDGRFVERSTKCTNRKDADALVAEWEKASRKALAGELTQAQSMKILDDMVFDSTGEQVKRESLSDFFKRWLDGKKTRKQFSTEKRYRPILMGYLDFIGPKRSAAIVGSVTPLEIARYRDEQLKEGKSPTTADFSIKVLSAALEAARKEGMSLTNPAESVERLNQAPEEKKPFTDQQVRKLLDHADGDWQGMVLLACHTGIRLSDAANLTWGCFDLEERTVTFIASKTASRRKTKRPESVVYLHGDFVAWLKSQIRGIGEAPVFPTLHGRKPGSAGGLSTAFTNLMKRAGIVSELGEEKEGKGRRFRELSFHSCRHTFCSRLANAAVSADVRKVIAGHSSDEIHDRYVHLDISAQMTAVNSMPSITSNLGES
ncbi:tyrosine-type recombinase/integrase [Coraliomargarita parva]|uniref:tyrosine-type recombinase/integrase n=1 Tax=Coraliomargarita parva TaxID=3014050 RepID=UPI0022B2CBB1|nr:site-specific integrase [Coraliomargarita parva]